MERPGFNLERGLKDDLSKSQLYFCTCMLYKTECTLKYNVTAKSFFERGLAIISNYFLGCHLKKCADTQRKAFFYETHTSKTVIPFSFLMEGSFYLSSYKIIVCKYIFFKISSDVSNVAIPLRIFFINLFDTFPGDFHIRQNQCFEATVVQNQGIE